MTGTTDRELFYLIARENAPTIWEEAQRAVRIASEIPKPEDLGDFVDDGECYECAYGLANTYPALTQQTGAYVGNDGRLRDHSWVVTPDGTIIDTTHGQFDKKRPILYAIPGSPDHQRYIRDVDMNEEQLHLTYGDESGIKPGEPGYSGPYTAATVEDSEPANNFGFLKEPHDELYPCAWIGQRMRPEARKAILDHVNKALEENGYPDAGRFINYSVYGSGASYNWDEDGDFDMQMWVDTDKFNEGKDEPMTEDDLVADIRRVVQLVNFPSFKELGLANEKSDGNMLIQYYAKPGQGTKEENLASKPYACFDLETEVWYQKPEPITPDFYGEWFILLEPKAKDIAMQASAVLESLERNIVEWSFWSQMYENHSDPRFKSKADDARKDAERDKEGAHNMFLNVFQGRAKAYSPEGEGYNDERDLMEKLLEVWGIFQRLRHAVKEALPWEEQELPNELPTEEDQTPDSEANDDPEKESKSKQSNKSWQFIEHWHIVAAEPLKLAETIHKILKDGGGTFNFDLTPSTFHDGYYASVYGYDQTVSVDDFGEASLQGYLDAVEGHPDYLIGAWVNDGIVYLDLTKHIPDRGEAIEFGIYNRQQAIWDIVKDEAVDLDPASYEPAPAFSKVAAWKDLMEKAKRLKDQGRVHILNNQSDHVIGRVEGDHGTYTTQIWRQDPNSRAITMWDCECPWDQYAWQRTRQWKKYEGRPCSHTLALFWTAQQTAAQQPQVSPDQMQLPGMGQPPTVPPPAPYQPGAPYPPEGLPPEQLPHPGTEPVLPRGPWEPTPQQPLVPPVGPPGAPLAPGAQPVPQGMQIDPRVLRNAPGGQTDPRFVPPATPSGTSHPQEQEEGGNFGFPGAFSKVTMAERSGDPELDALIEGFIQKNPTLHPPTNNPWKLSPVQVQDLQDREKAVNTCSLAAESFRAYLREHGMFAEVPAATTPYWDIPGDFDDPGLHCAVVIHRPRGQTYMIDFSSRQFPDVQEWPLVMRIAPGQSYEQWEGRDYPGFGEEGDHEYGELDPYGVWEDKWSMRISAFENGTIVRAEKPLEGVDRDGRQWRVPRNSKGEVLSSDEDVTIAIFPLNTGPLEPHLVRVNAETSAFSQSHGKPFIGR
jgi:hypothetical protein